MRHNIIPSGTKFNYFTIIGFHHRQIDKNKYMSCRYYYLCKCDCGKEKIVRIDQLKSGKTVSCGCYHHSIIKDIQKKNCTKHNLCHTRLYNIWKGIHGRCNRKTLSSYKNYGGRGIKVCEEWEKDFMNFYNWAMNNGYSDNLTIDRIDNNGNYEPSNCRWATPKQQCNNQRKTIFITYKGKKQSLRYWCEELGIKYDIALYRYYAGYKPKDIFDKKKIKEPVILEYKGEKHNIAEWGRIMGLCPMTIKDRLCRFGYTIEEALTKKPYQKKRELLGLSSSEL